MEMGYDINIGVHKLKMWVVGKIEKARHTVRCFLLFSLNCTALLIVHFIIVPSKFAFPIRFELLIKV